VIPRGGSLAAVAITLFISAASVAAPLDVPGVPPGPLRVALLSATNDDPLAGRLDAELHTIGLDVSRSVVSPTMGIEEQVRRELAGGARAVIVADGHRTDVWISEPGSDRVALRQDLEVDQTSGLQAVLALRTVEFLRISLGLVSAPTVVPLEPAPAVARTLSPSPPPEPRRWLAIDVSSGVLASVGGLGAMAVAGLSLRAQLAGLVGAELCAYFPLTDSELSETEGQARTSVSLAGGGLLLAPLGDRRLSFDLAAGTLAVFVRTTGTPTAAGPEMTDAQIGLALYARGAARFRLAERLALRIDLLAGSAVRRPVISVAGGRDIATWGTAFAAGMGGAELRF
jgi:hypothetical protein